MRGDARAPEHHPPVVRPGMGLRLALGVFLPPFAWAADLEAGVFSLQHVCESGHRGVLHLSSAIALLLVLVGGGLAWSAGREIGDLTDVADRGDDGSTARSRLFAVGGLLFALLFGLLVVGTAIPRFVLPPC